VCQCGLKRQSRRWVAFKRAGGTCQLLQGGAGVGSVGFGPGCGGLCQCRGSLRNLAVGHRQHPDIGRAQICPTGCGSSRAHKSHRLLGRRQRARQHILHAMEAAAVPGTAQGLAYPTATNDADGFHGANNDAIKKIAAYARSTGAKQLFGLKFWIGLNDLGNRRADVVNVLAVERGHAHAPGVGAIHTKLIAQAHHLVFGQA